MGKQNIAISKKQFAFEEITYLHTADRELQKMLDMHISKLNYNLVDNETMQTEQTPPSNQNINAKNHLGVGNRVRWMRISLEQTPSSNSNTTNNTHYDDMIIPSFPPIKNNTV